MILSEIESLVLANIRHTRYSALSISTDANDVEDFGFLHRCVLLAREEIKRYCKIPDLMKRDTITTVANQKKYSLASDFHLPVKGIYRTADTEFALVRVYPENLLQKLSGNKTTSTGIPSMYMILGTSSDVIQVELYLIPDTAGETAELIYKPVLANLTTSTDEDVLMAKHPQTVIKFVTAFAFQFIKQDAVNFGKWYALGYADLDKIAFDELDADSNYRELPSASLRRRRQSRFSK